MITQKREIQAEIEKNGWKISVLDNSDFYKWSMETWLIESIWSPVGATAFVSFLIDPMSDFQNPSVWAIEISDAKPMYGKERNHFTVSLKQWKNETADFLNFLSQIRSNAK